MKFHLLLFKIKKGHLIGGINCHQYLLSFPNIWKLFAIPNLYFLETYKSPSLKFFGDLFLPQNLHFCFAYNLSPIFSQSLLIWKSWQGESTQIQWWRHLHLETSITSSNFFEEWSVEETLGLKYFDYETNYITILKWFQNKP